jgi:hypothetical protein
VPPSCGAPGEIADGRSVQLDVSLASPAVPVRCPDGASLGGFTMTPAQAFRYEVMGSGSRAVTITTANDQTPVAADTIIAVYEGDCDPARVALACFDDSRAQGRYERRANGTVLATNGQHLTIVVGYYSDTGSLVPAQVDVSSRENRAPTIAGADVLFLDDRVALWAEASDPDGDTDVTRLEVAFVGPLGELIPVDGAATQLAEAVRVGASYEATLGIDALPEGAAEVEVRAVDAAGVRSEGSVTAPRADGTLVGIGAPCDGPRGPEICLGELECPATGPDAGTCTPSPLVTAACGAATPFPLAMTDGRWSGRASVTIEAGPGAFRYPFQQCPEGDLDSALPRTQGREQLFAIPLPAGRWDVLATTSGTGSLDTLLYARTACDDPESTNACADDIDVDANDLYSALEVRDQLAPAAGATLYLIAELWDGPAGSASERFDVDVRLRPVRASGETCDSTFVADRCASTPCRGGMCP